jgi:hypothetical protein
MLSLNEYVTFTCTASPGALHVLPQAVQVTGVVVLGLSHVVVTVVLAAFMPGYPRFCTYVWIWADVTPQFVKTEQEEPRTIAYLVPSRAASET